MRSPKSSFTHPWKEAVTLNVGRAATQRRVLSARLVPMASLPDPVIHVLDRVGRAGGKVAFLTGAGISAESGIPTFRGPEGYWRVGSQVYEPEEIATHAMFARMPEEVWR